MYDLSIIQKILIWSIPVIFAITLHEVAHGWVAYKLGDPTAKMLGRLTINPIKHIDPVGTILVPGILLLLPHVSFIFGWAKPVPVSYQNLRHPRRDMALVAAAGPISNFLMALFWGLIAKLGIMVGLNDSAAIHSGLTFSSLLIFVSAMPNFIFSYFGYAHFPFEFVFPLCPLFGYAHYAKPTLCNYSATPTFLLK